HLSLSPPPRRSSDLVAVVTSPDDYAPVMAEMTAKHGDLGLATRKRLAAAAFARTAAYDAAIAGWMSRDEPLAPRLVLAGERRQRSEEHTSELQSLTN